MSEQFDDRAHSQRITSWLLSTRERKSPAPAAPETPEAQDLADARAHSQRITAWLLATRQ